MTNYQFTIFNEFSMINFNFSCLGMKKADRLADLTASSIAQTLRKATPTLSARLLAGSEAAGNREAAWLDVHIFFLLYLPTKVLYVA